MKCIFCDNENNAKSVEHIVPESFGNTFYALPKGSVCDDCNNNFSKFEGKALTNTVFVVERARFGVVTKKGKNAKGKVNELIVAVYYTINKQQSGRMEIEKDIRCKYNFPCGVR